MTDETHLSPYDTVCRMNENNRKIQECEKAVQDLEQLGHIIFRLEHNEVLRELNLMFDIHDENQKLHQMTSGLSRTIAELQAENGDLHWNLKYVMEVPEKRGRGRPRTRKEE